MWLYSRFKWLQKNNIRLSTVAEGILLSSVLKRLSSFRRLYDVDWKAGNAVQM